GSFVTTRDKLTELEARGFSAASKLKSLLDRPMPGSAEAYWMEVGATLDATERSALATLVQSGASPYVDKPGQTIGFAGDGWLGQQLIVLPSRGIVAVRQHREPVNEEANDEYNKRYGFLSLVRRLDRAAER